MTIRRSADGRNAEYLYRDLTFLLASSSSVIPFSSSPPDPISCEGLLRFCVFRCIRLTSRAWQFEHMYISFEGEVAETTLMSAKRVCSTGRPVR